jgi:hypothetical protein
MNIERLETIACWLEDGGDDYHPVIPFKFDMEVWGGGHCGTPACIAGAAAAVWGPERPHRGTRDEAVIALGLSDQTAEELFEAIERDDNDRIIMDNGWPDLNEIDAAWAARTVRHLIATGEVRWDLTRHPEKANG